MDPAAGMLLVASPRLEDANFRHSVVYLVEHNDTGTLGFIINRPLELPLSELWSEVPPGLAVARLAGEGGPVDRHKGLLLHACMDLAGAHPVSPTVAVGGDVDALAARWPDGGDVSGPRLFLGHSGWGLGQLERELEEGAWILRPGRPELLFDPYPAVGLWQQLIEGRYGMPDPSRN
jgi:putative transcriptional regulator